MMEYRAILIAEEFGELLHPLERGNPVRVFETRTLADAVCIINAFALGSGHAVLRGPRRVRPGCTYGMHGFVKEHRIRTQIERVGRDGQWPKGGAA